MTDEEIISRFAPYIEEKFESLKGGKRLVHYTSAESAYRIITGRTIWLRNAQVMNDFSEIQHGIRCLRAAYQTRIGDTLKNMLQRIDDRIAGELESIFGTDTDELRNNTYIASFSEHDDLEDSYGRLSMWRAYGGQSGVALVLNNKPFTSLGPATKFISAPVLYKDTDRFVEWFEGWARGIVEIEDELRARNPDSIRNTIFMVFRELALCTKHPGFTEEREWRTYYSPSHEGRSNWIDQSIEIVRGVPQKLMQLQLRDDPSQDVEGLAPDLMLNRVIIGPCDHPLQVRAAMIHALASIGVADPGGMTTVSRIPLRN